MEHAIHIARGLLGMAAFVGIAWAFSGNRRAINWRLVGAGLLLHLLIGLVVLHVGPMTDRFRRRGRAFSSSS